MAASPKQPHSLVLQTRSSDETRQLASAIAPLLVPGDVLVLSGDLGAGKTTFVQGLAKGLGIVERVTSPTFILMKEYPGGRFPLMHLDVYRLGKIQEVIDLGIDEYLDPSYVVAVEWGDRVEPLLPQDHLTVELTHEGSDSRKIRLTPKGSHWEARMATLVDLAGGLKMSRRAKEPVLGEDFQPETNESGRNN